MRSDSLLAALDLKLLHRYIEWLGYGLLSPLRWLLQWCMARYGLVFVYRVYSSGLGDTLAITAVIAALARERGRVRAIVFSKYPALFESNPLVCCNLDYQRMPRLQRSLLKSAAKYLRGSQVICVGLEKWVLGTLPWRPYVESYAGRWLRQMVPDYPVGRSAMLASLETITPQLFFSDEEQSHYARRFAGLPPSFSVIKATANAERGFRVLKDWRVDRMQAVVTATAGQTTWLQIGDVKEPLLSHRADVTAASSCSGIIDMRGLPLRDSLYLLSRARLTLTVEGFISHAAAAFPAPVLVVFSGYHDAGTLAYANTVVITAETPPPCAPCYLTACSQSRKHCTEDIPVQQVVQAVMRQWRDPILGQAT